MLARLQADRPQAERLTALSLLVHAAGRERDTDQDAGAEARQAKVEFLVPDADDAAALETLDALRLKDRDLADGPLDVDALARRILHLEGDAASLARADARADLFALVRGAVAAGRVSNLAALGAYHLQTAGGAYHLQTAGG
ncbi:hypothetical protein AB4Z54_66750, partial [Streptomyces sp. MCAF7]